MTSRERRRFKTTRAVSGCYDEDAHPKLCLKIEQGTLDRVKQFAREHDHAITDAVRLLLCHALDKFDEANNRVPPHEPNRKAAI